MKPIEKLSHHRLFWVLSALFPLIIFVFVMQILFTRQQESSIDQLMHAAAENAAHAVELAIGEQIGLLNGLAASRFLDDDDFESFRLDVQRIGKMHPEWRTIILTNEDQPVFNLRYPPGEPIPPLWNPESLQPVWSAMKPSVGNLANGYVAIRVPVIRNGRINYTLVAPTDPQFFNQALKVSQKTRKWDFIIIGSDDAVVLASTKGLVSVGKPLPPGFLKKERGTLAASATIRSGEWRIFVFAPATFVDMPFRTIRLVVYLNGFLAAVVTTMLVLTLSSAWASKQETIRLRKEITARNQAEHALRESEQWRRLAQSAAGAGTWEWDLQTNKVIWSDELWPLYGLVPNSCEPSYDQWLKTIHPNDRWKVQKAVKAAAQDEKTLNVEWRMQRSDGDVTWLMARGQPIKDDLGCVVRYLGIVMDISELKNTEAALRHSEEYYRTTLNSIGDAVITTDTHGNITHLNPIAEALTGWMEKDGCGKPLETIFRIINEESRQPVENPAVKVLREGRVVGLANHTLLISRDGKETPIADSGAPISNKEGRIIGVVLVFRDQTEERENLKSISSSEHRFRLFVENAPEAVFVQVEGRFAYLNQATAELFGVGHSDELTGKPILERYHPDYRHLVRERMRILNEERNPVPRMRFVCLQMDGTPIEIELSAVPFEYDGKHGSLVFARDMTASQQARIRQKELEQQLLQAQKMESVGRLAGGVAHDYNNMLSVIVGYSELALDKVEPADPLYSDLREILAAAQRSSNITRQLLAFARQQTIVPKALDLNNTVERMLNMLRRLIGEDIDLVWHPQEGLWPVKMDPTQIDQILANLCVNARDAITDVGKITIETDMRTLDKAYCALHLGFVPGDFVVLAVSDDGCGIDRADLNNIFEPFFTTKGVGRGTGLGLATVYGIVKQNNGFINVYSEPDKGTTFRIYLPRQADQALADQPHGEAGIPKGHGEMVLVVEDETLILKLAEKMLVSLDYRVLVAKTPADALKLVEAFPDDITLLVTDVVMPDMNGRELAERLQSLYPRLKCLFMSGYTADVIAHRGILEAGVNFIQKPFSRQDLAVKIKAALG